MSAAEREAAGNNFWVKKYWWKEVLSSTTCRDDKTKLTYGQKWVERW